MPLTLEDTLAATNPNILSPDGLTPQNEVNFTNILLSFLGNSEFGQFPITAWQDGSALKALVQADSHALADLGATVYNVIQGGILDLATGDWLDFWGQGQYQEARNPAVQEVGYAWITIQAPLNLLESELTVAATSIQQYTPVQAVVDVNGDTTYVPAPLNLSSGSYPAQFQIIVQATDITPGSLGYCRPGDIGTIVSPQIPGATITNLNPDSTGNWELVKGEDAELDDVYRARLKTKWPSLSLLRGSTLSAWGYWVTEATPLVRRYNVLENTPAGGQVTIYVDPSTAVTGVNNFINGNESLSPPVYAHRPLCTTVYVYAATTTSIAVGGYAFVPTSWLSAAQTSFQKAIASLSARLPMGSTIYLSTIIAFIQESTHVDHCEGITLNGTGDIVLGPNAVPYIYDTLTWVGI